MSAATPGHRRVGIAPVRGGLRAFGVVVPLASALLLMYTGFEKLQDVSSFREAVRSHGLIPDDVAAWVADFVPMSEVAIGILTLVSLAIGAGRWAAAWAQFLLFLAFMAYAGAMDFAPPQPEPTGCGCGLRAGPIEDWTPLVIQNGACAVLVGLAGVVAAQGTARRKGPSTEHGVLPSAPNQAGD